MTRLKQKTQNALAFSIIMPILGTVKFAECKNEAVPCQPHSIKCSSQFSLLI